jgi:hypothetical protein
VRRLLASLAVALVLAPAARNAAAAGAWQTLQHTYNVSALEVDADTLWCATLEAGLVHYDVTTHAFTTLSRAPTGLQSNHLTALALDRTGMLWVGTEGIGVSRLFPDRATWDLLSRFDGVPSDTINVLTAHGDSVWIGTPQGIALWDGNTIAGAIPDGVNPSPFASNNIVGIAQLGDSVWVATLGGVYVSDLATPPLTWTAVNQGLFAPAPVTLGTDGVRLFTIVNTVPYRFDVAAGQWRFAGNWPGVGATLRMSDDHGVVVISTHTGIYRWDPAAPPAFSGDPPGDWVAIQTGPPFGSGSDPDSAGLVFATATDAAGVVTWAANQDGVRALTPSCGACAADRMPGPPGNNIINLALEGSTVYVNSYVEGVGRYDGVTWRNWYAVSCGGGPACDSTFVDPIYNFGLHVDARGHKWVACWSGPTEEFNDAVSPPTFIHHQEAWADPVPAPERHSFGWALANDPSGGIWIGLESNGNTTPVTALGLDHYDASGAYVGNLRPDNVPSMAGQQIRGLVVDGRGRLWVGFTGEGVQYFDFPLPPSGIPSFTSVGGTENFFVQSLALHGDSLWVLTTDDLRRYDARSARLVLGSVVSPPGATSQNALRPLAIGPDGAVWLGTEKGLRVYRPGGAIEDFNTANSPLASNEVRAVVVDPATGVVWAGTSEGMNRYDPHYLPPGQSAIGALRLSIYPNPITLTGIGVGLRLKGAAATYDGAVYDLNGRMIRRFSGVPNGGVFWDGLDQHGSVVRPGVYFVHASGGGRTATARVAMVR